MKKLILLFAISNIFSCAPTVTLDTKPVEINLNVKIDHKISVKVDKQLENVMKENEDIF